LIKFRPEKKRGGRSEKRGVRSYGREFRDGQ
jgi:hypothetical protein